MPIALLETSEEDAFLVVAQHIGNLLNEGQNKTALAETPGSRFVDDCSNLLAEERVADYCSRVVDQLDVLLNKSEKQSDVEGCLNVLGHAVARIAPEQQAAVATLVVQALSKSDDHPEVRVAGLLNLYNCTSAPAAQHAVLLAAADFSKRNPAVSQQLGGAVKGGKAETWIKEWGLNETQARELLLALASVMKACGDRVAANEYARLMQTALALARAGDAPALAQLKPHAVSALADYLRSPQLHSCDLLEMASVAQLAGDKQYGALHGLVVAMQAGDFAAVRSAATPEALQPAGMAAEAVLSKGRMVALLARCCRAGHAELALTELAAVLEVSADQVEQYVVRAIGMKMLEGKVDQVRGVFLITRSTQPTFGGAQWKELGTKLATLKAQLQGALGLLATVQQPQTMHARAAAAAAAPTPVRAA